MVAIIHILVMDLWVRPLFAADQDHQICLIFCTDARRLANLGAVQVLYFFCRYLHSSVSDWRATGLRFRSLAMIRIPVLSLQAASGRMSVANEVDVTRLECRFAGESFGLSPIVSSKGDNGAPSVIFRDIPLTPLNPFPVYRRISNHLYWHWFLIGSTFCGVLLISLERSLWLGIERSMPGGLLGKLGLACLGAFIAGPAWLVSLAGWFFVLALKLPGIGTLATFALPRRLLLQRDPVAA